MADQNSQYMAMLTAVGEAKLANATALGVNLNITQLGVGDANGAEPMPSRTQTALINERRRAPLNQLSIDPNNSAIIIAEQVIPEDIGGWWIREIGLYDEAGDLIAVANCPPTFKPELAQGSGRTQVVRLNILVSSTQNIQLKIDPSVVLATRKYVDDLTVRASQANAEAGTDNSKLMTPLRVWQAISKRFSSQTQAEGGTDNETLMSPLRVFQVMTKYGLGSIAVPLLTTVGDTTTPSGLYRVDGTAIGLPIAEPGFVDIRRGGSGLVSQRYYSRSSPRAFFRRANGSLGAWEEFMHSGTAATQAEAEAGSIADRWMSPLRSLQLLAKFGLGGACATWPHATLNVYTQATGFYRATSGVTDGPYSAYWGVRVEKAPDGSYVRQSIWDLNKASGYYERTISNGNPGPWIELSHSGNAALQVDAETGTDNSKWMSPLRVFQAIAKTVVQATETVIGVAKVATQAQTNAGTDDATIVTPKKLRMGIAYSFGTNGYFFLPSWLFGFGLQWGEVPNVAADGVQNVSFPVAFVTEVFGMLANLKTETPGTQPTAVYSIPTSVSGGKVVRDVSTSPYATGPIFWLALGR